MSGNGYMGKILRVDLTSRKISTLETKKYEQWGGGHGIGSAIFWDLCEDKTIDGFDPRNVVTIMTSPLSGTLVPGCSGRTEVQGIGVQQYPIPWFTRSNFGGRFGTMLKLAGWDGIVLEGKAEKPVWIDIRNGEVEIRDAKNLWGLDTRETQEKIWDEVSGGMGAHDWWQVGAARDGGRTTMRPAVLTIGFAGEYQSRMASLVHDAGNGAGQGGFGGVWGLILPSCTMEQASMQEMQPAHFLVSTRMYPPEAGIATIPLPRFNSRGRASPRPRPTAKTLAIFRN